MATSNNFDAATLTEIGNLMTVDSTRPWRARPARPSTATDSSFSTGESTATTCIVGPTGEDASATSDSIGSERGIDRSLSLLEPPRADAATTEPPRDTLLGRTSTGLVTTSLSTPPHKTTTALPGTYVELPRITAKSVDQIGSMATVDCSDTTRVSKEGCLNDDAEDTEDETDEDGEDDEEDEQHNLYEGDSSTNASPLSGIHRRILRANATYRAEEAMWCTFRSEYWGCWVKSVQEHHAATAASIHDLEQTAVALVKAKDALDKANAEYVAAAPSCKDSAHRAILEAESEFYSAFTDRKQFITTVWAPIDARLAVAKKNFDLGCEEFTKGWTKASKARDRAIKKAKADEVLAIKERQIADTKKQISELAKKVKSLETKNEEQLNMITMLSEMEETAKAEARAQTKIKKQAKLKAREVEKRAEDEVAKAQEAEAAAKRRLRDAEEAAERRVREAEETAKRRVQEAEDAAEKRVRDAERKMREAQAKAWDAVSDDSSDSENEDVDSSAYSKLSVD